MTDPNAQDPNSPWAPPMAPPSSGAAPGEPSRDTAPSGPADSPRPPGAPEPPRPERPAAPFGEDEPRTPPPSSAISQQLPVPLPPVTRPPAGSAYGYPARYSDAPGTGRFQLALPQLGTITAGPAIGSLVTGIAALVVAVGVACSGLGAVLVTIAVTVLAVFFGGAAILLAGLAFRQIARGGGEYTGRGIAIGGLSCGAVAIGFAGLIAAVIIMSG